MRKHYILSTLIALLMTQQSFANTPSSDSCKTIANACINAGFTRTDNSGKSFWHDCMQPILLGETVAGIKIDSKDVVICRKFKIIKMQKELEKLKKAANAV